MLGKTRRFFAPHLKEKHSHSNQLSNLFTCEPDLVYMTSDSYEIETSTMPNPQKSPKSMDFDSYDEHSFAKGVSESHGNGSSYLSDHAVWTFIEFDSPMQKNKKKISTRQIVHQYDLKNTVPHIHIEQAEKTPNHNRTKGSIKAALEYFRTRKKIVYKMQELNSKYPRISIHNSMNSSGKKCKPNDVSCKVTTPTTTSSSTQSLSDCDNDDYSFWNDLNINECALNDFNLRYSRRSEIPSHGMMQSISMSEMSMLPCNPNQSHLRVSYWAEQNKRSYMEDRFIVDGVGAISFKGRAKNNINEIEPATVFAVFDGHAGALASQYCSDFFSSYLCTRARPFFFEDVPMALKKTFISLDKDFISTGNNDGTTACVALVIGKKKVICANAGDSRAIVVRSDGSIASLSNDHKPNSPAENRRIHELGGRVLHMGMGTWRLEGRLSVSRSIGDVSLKPYVSASE